MKAIIGLGNTGSEYENTKHNIGFLFIDTLSINYNISLNLKKYSCISGTGNILGKEVLLAKPLTYMNRSGVAVKSILDVFTLTHGDLIIVHDDIDIQLGRVKKKEKGGDAGHRGIRSIIGSIHADNFLRIRIGVGRPPHMLSVSDYVLSPFKNHELDTVRGSINTAIQKVEEILINS